MLDTNIVTFAMRARPQVVLDRLRRLRPDQTRISAVTLAELRYGAARSSARARYDGLIDTFIARVIVEPLDASVADTYGEVRADLARRGVPIGDLDMLIGAHALSAGCVLVTNNLREFNRIAGLTVEAWSVG